MKFLLAVLINFVGLSFAYSQSDSTFVSYDIALNSLDSLAKMNEPRSFKQAVFLVENTFYEKKIEYKKFDNYIQELSNLAKDWMLFNNLKGYRYSDSIQLLNNLAVYKVLKDTIRIKISDTEAVAHLPYSYSFEDYKGDKDWSSMFVTKLMVYHEGNCHSLPYLYKILADELNAPCWLGLAPNHIYIKNRCKGQGWYNTELTSGSFPIDAWITASGYIPLQAIQNGIYMDTLSNQQAIALCILDLAKGYEFQTKNYSDGFILRCCDLVLKYHPVNVQALLLKAETTKRIYEQQQKDKNQSAGITFKDMESMYAKLFELGYREMPDKMYLDWLRSVTTESKKYSNEKLKSSVKSQNSSNR